jgi:WD40 repeat protein
LHGHTDWVEAVAMTPDAARVVSASQRDVRTWDIASGSAVSTFAASSQYSISALALSNDGLRLACGVRDGTVRIWDVGVDTPRWTLRTSDAWTKSLAFSADGKFVAAGDWLGTLRVWDLETDGTKVREQDAHGGAPIASLAFRPDGGQLATGSYDATIKLWDTATWKLTQTLTGHKGLVLSLTYSPDSQVLASGERHGVIKLWNSAGDVLRTIVAHPDEKLGFSVTGLAFSPDGKRFASCSYDRTIKIWPLE